MCLDGPRQKLGGAWGVEVEVVPAERRSQISARTRLVTTSIGAGSGGDIQFMFAEHTKQYRNIYQMEQAIQAERVAGFREYVSDVKSGAFSGPEPIVKAPAGLIDEFLAAINPTNNDKADTSGKR